MPTPVSPPSDIQGATGGKLGSMLQNGGLTNTQCSFGLNKNTSLCNNQWSPIYLIYRENGRDSHVVWYGSVTVLALDPLRDGPGLTKLPQLCDDIDAGLQGEDPVQNPMGPYEVQHQAREGRENGPWGSGVPPPWFLRDHMLPIPVHSSGDEVDD
ncbi:hypothetical protein MKZ38_006070 [Zalerion maritima]|uniref:Uncharacterized protein n=1 Tax=Zalerion maritima TaxID=339359 RepID=A0AAD5WNM8_9PEZI|nr:hypothetical protein MKZ38_006070 [Zalerion maritima]